jgi:alkaline phosphatase D
LEVEFVGLPKPLQPSANEDGDPLLYRVRFRTAPWRVGEAPRMETHLVEGEWPFGST